jgi:uncharacterized protein
MLKTMLLAGGMLLAATPAFAEETKMPRIISLTGHGESRTPPDMATINIGVMTSAATAREAVSGNNDAMKAVLDTLATAKIEAHDIQTSNFMVNPRYDYNNNNNSQPPKVVGYDASNSVSVTVRKLADVGSVLDKVVSAGSNQINGITFDVSKPDEALDQARKLAVEDARHRAEVYAQAAGVKLGPIMSMSENAGYQPVPQTYAKSMRAAADSAVPVQGGEQVISADVSMSWEIQ